MLFYKKCKISAAPIFNTSCIEDPDQVCIRHPDMGPHSMLFAFLASISHLSILLGQVTIIQIYRLRWPKTTYSTAHLAREVTVQTALSDQRRPQPSESATGASSAVRVAGPPS